MTVFHTGIGLLKPVSAELTTTNSTSVFTAGANGAILEYVRAVLATSTATTLLLDIAASAGAATGRIIRPAASVSNFAVLTDRDAIMMEPNQVLRAQKSSASSADAIHITGLAVEPQT